MGFSYNNGQVTPMRGSATVGFHVTFGASGAPTLVDRGKSGFIASVAKTATGRYTFTLNAPFPASVIDVIAGLSCVNASGAIQHARYVEGSYSASAGTLEIDVTDNAGSPAAVDPTENTAMHVAIEFQRYTNL